MLKRPARSAVEPWNRVAARHLTPPSFHWSRSKREPCRAASTAAMSIFFIVIIPSDAAAAWPGPPLKDERIPAQWNSPRANDATAAGSPCRRWWTARVHRGARRGRWAPGVWPPHRRGPGSTVVWHAAAGPRPLRSQPDRASARTACGYTLVLRANRRGRGQVADGALPGNRHERRQSHSVRQPVLDRDAAAQRRGS